MPLWLTGVGRVEIRAAMEREWYDNTETPSYLIVARPLVRMFRLLFAVPGSQSVVDCWISHQHLYRHRRQPDTFVIVVVEWKYMRGGKLLSSASKAARNC